MTEKPPRELVQILLVLSLLLQKWQVPSMNKGTRELLQIMLVLQLMLQKWQVLSINIPRKSPPSRPLVHQLGQLWCYHFPRYRMKRVWAQIHFLSYQSSFRFFLYQAPFCHFIVWLTRICGQLNDLLRCGNGNWKLLGKIRWGLRSFQSALVARVPVRLTC